VGKILPVAKTPLIKYLLFYKHLGFGCQEMICKLSCKRDENASMYNSNIYNESMKSTDLKKIFKVRSGFKVPNVFPQNNNFKDSEFKTHRLKTQQMGPDTVHCTLLQKLGHFPRIKLTRNCLD
jgi:hypothetical protein